MTREPPDDGDLEEFGLDVDAPSPETAPTCVSVAPDVAPAQFRSERLVVEPSQFRFERLIVEPSGGGAGGVFGPTIPTIPATLGRSDVFGPTTLGKGISWDSARPGVEISVDFVSSATFDMALFGKAVVP